MRIVNVVDPTQGQVLVHHRVLPPPTTSPPRRVAAINQPSTPDSPERISTAPPDDGINLALSPESREAARQAAIEELRAQQAEREARAEELTEAAEEHVETPSAFEEAEQARKRAQDARTIEELAARDRQVRSHERAHAAAAGSLVRSAAAYTFQMGPDGRLYAVGGEIHVDTSPVPGDPDATLRKAEQLEQAAFASGDPSPEDRRIASLAAAMAAHARQELARQQARESHEAADEPSHVVDRNG